MSVSLVEASGSSQTQKWGSESLENGLYGYPLSAGPRIKDDWYHMHCVVSLCRVTLTHVLLSLCFGAYYAIYAKC